MNEPDPKPNTALQGFDPAPEDVYSIETVVHLTRASRHQIAVYCRHGLISPGSLPEREGWRFDPEAIRRIRQLEALREDYRMNLAALRVTARLLEEVERLREEVRGLRRA